MKALEKLQEFGVLMSHLYPDGHSSVVLIADRLPAPQPETQAAIGKLFGARSSLACVAIILEGSGFWASGIRCMITNTHRDATGRAKLHVSTSVEGALSWLPTEHAQATGIEIDAHLLHAFIAHLREHVANMALNG
jgi:hypothetical protein